MSVYVSKRKSPISKGVIERYKNFSVVSDGKKSELREVLPVTSGLADEYSVTMNSLEGRQSRPRGRRFNVDALDLDNVINNLKS